MQRAINLVGEMTRDSIILTIEGSILIDPERRCRVNELLQFIFENAVNFFPIVFRINQPIFPLVIVGFCSENGYVHDVKNARLLAVAVLTFFR